MRKKIKNDRQSAIFDFIPAKFGMGYQSYNQLRVWEQTVDIFLCEI